MRKRRQVHINYVQQRRNITHLPKKSDTRQHAFRMQMRTDDLYISSACEQMKVIRKPLQNFRKRGKIPTSGKFMQIAECRRNRARVFESDNFSRYGLAFLEPQLDVRCRRNPFGAA